MSNIDKNIFEYNLFENLTGDMEFDTVYLINKMKNFKVSEVDDFDMVLEFKNQFLNAMVQDALDKMTLYGTIRWYAMYNVLYNALCKLYDVEIPWMNDDYNTLEEAFSGKIATCTLTVINPLNTPLQSIYSSLLGLDYISAENALNCFNILMNCSINSKSVEDAIMDMAERILPYDIANTITVNVTPIIGVTKVTVDRYRFIHAFPMEYHVKVSSKNGYTEEFNTKALLITVAVLQSYYSDIILKYDVIPAKEDVFLNNEIDDIYQYVSSLITDPKHTIDLEPVKVGITTDLTAIGEYINTITEDCQIGDIEIEDGYQFYFAGALKTIFGTNTTAIPDVTPGYTDWDWDEYDDDDDEDDLDDDEEEDENYDEDDDK